MALPKVGDVVHYRTAGGVCRPGIIVNVVNAGTGVVDLDGFTQTAGTPGFAGGANVARSNDYTTANAWHWIEHHPGAVP